MEEITLTAHGWSAVLIIVLTIIKFIELLKGFVLFVVDLVKLITNRH